MDQAGEAAEEAGHRGDLLDKFWLKPKINEDAVRNAMENNPLKIVERAFQSLREDEQRRVRRDQYGEEEPIEESTAFVEKKLEELEREINLLSDNTRKAYNEALQQEIQAQETVASAFAAAAAAAAAAGENRDSSSDQKMTPKASSADQHDKEAKEDRSDDEDLANKGKDQAIGASGCKEYIRSKSFRLMFLRAETFNARLAARRISRYFKEKKELFGSDKLARRIKQADLNETDKEVIRSGCFCSTGAMDEHGRLIVFIQRILMDNFPVDNIRRGAFYVFQIVEDSDDWQRKGVVFVGDGRGLGIFQPASERRLYPGHRMVFYAMPFRHACIHACYDTLVHHFFFKLALVVIPHVSKSRIVTHYATTPQEIFSQLSEHDIDPVEDLPFTPQWAIHEERIRNFLSHLQQREEESETTEEE